MDMALNNLQRLICHKTQTINKKMICFGLISLFDIRSTLVEYLIFVEK